MHLCHFISSPLPISMLQRWPSLPTTLSNPPGERIIRPCLPPLWPTKCQQRLWESCEIVQFLMQLHQFSSGPLQIFVLPQWPNLQTGIYCPPGKMMPSPPLFWEKSGEIGDFLTGLVLFTYFVVLKTYAFTLSFVLSHFVVVWRGRGTFHNKTIHNDFCTWGGELNYWFYVDFVVALIFPHPVFSLHVWCNIWLFA